MTLTDHWEQRLYPQQMLALVQEVKLTHFPSKTQGHLTWWAYLLGLLGHIEAQYVCIFESRRLGLNLILSTKGPQIPALFLPSIVAMPVDMNS